MKLLLSAILLVAVGCASTKDSMESWVGHSDSELVSALGAPDRKSELSNGCKVYTWVRHWHDRWTPQEGRQNFTIAPNGKIVGWSFQNMP